MASIDHHSQTSSQYNTTRNNQGDNENYRDIWQGAIDRAIRGDYKLLLALGATGVGAYACYKVIQRHNPDKDWQAICYIISTNPFVYVPLGVALNELKNYALAKPEIEPSDLQQDEEEEEEPTSSNEGLASDDNRDRTASNNEESDEYSQTYQEFRDPPHGFNQESVPEPMNENSSNNPNRAFGSQAQPGTSQQASNQSRYTQQEPYVSQPPPTGHVGDRMKNSEVYKNVDVEVKINFMQGKLRVGDEVDDSKLIKTGKTKVQINGQN